MIRIIEKCRGCGNDSLTSVLSLGTQELTGVFPRNRTDSVTKGPLELVWCSGCGLLQLRHSYELDEMYGSNYGYRSGLNESMVRHLTNKINYLEGIIKLSKDDIVVDIGSNDATSLRAYSSECVRVGIDPTGNKFRQYYTSDMHLISNFFSAEIFKEYFGNRKAKIITSIAMFYDLESPGSFVEDINEIMDSDGIWHFEQSYMPSMLRTNAYDTICHEHLEFYSFGVVKNLLERYKMRVIDIQMNSINGGSFAVTACKKDASYKSNIPIIEWMLRQEDDMALHTPKPYRDFEDRVYKHRKNLKELIEALTNNGKTVFGYGASTKGNVLLQFCGFTEREIPFIAEINEEKFESFTPGSHIPIISEKDAKKMFPDYFLVLPWHFKHSILEREKEYMRSGGKFIFPLPEIEIV